MTPRWEGNTDIRRGLPSLHAHLVFTPKYRRGPFTGEILAGCEEIMRDVRADFGAELRGLNGKTDHVHLLVRYPPKIALSRLVGSLKGVSARRLRQKSPARILRHPSGEHFRSPSYFAASCGGAPLAIIKDYIQQQNHRPNPMRSAPGLKARGSPHHNAEIRLEPLPG